MAGKGGLNLTHSEPFDQFLARYGERKVEIEPWLRPFGPEEVRQWAQGLGVETFTGSSKRVFPVEMKSTPLLRAWMRRLREAGVIFHFRHIWKGWDEFRLIDLRCACREGFAQVEGNRAGFRRRQLAGDRVDGCMGAHPGGRGHPGGAVEASQLRL